MADTFDRLMALRPSPRPVIDPGRSTIAIKGVDPFRSFSEHACAIEIDGRLRSTLYAFRTQVLLEVDAGDHQISVRLGRDRSVPLPIRIEPGARIELICGKKLEWIALESRLIPLSIVHGFTCLGLGVLAWLAYPFLRWMVVGVLILFDLEGGFASLCHKLVMFRGLTAAIVVVACYFPSLIVLAVRYHQEIRRLRDQLGPSCYVAIRPPEIIKQKSPTLSWDGE